MGEEVQKLAGKLGIDTTDFKTALGAANRELRVLESGFRASAASLQDWAGDATGLELRIKSLTGQIDIQKSKVDALRAEHARLAEEHGVGSRAAQDAEIKLNKETETLNKMQSELGGTETKLADLRAGNEAAGDSAKEMGDKVEKSGSKLETFKSILGGVGKVAAGAVAGIAAVGAAALAAIAMMAGLAFHSAAAADELADLSVKTGISTTRLQELSFAGKILGTDLETITGANARLIRSMAGAQDGTGAQAQAFAALGVSVTGANGELRDSQAVMGEVFDRLQAIQNPVERDALAMELFGKSAQELNPLIAAGSAGLAELANQAHRMGAVMSEEDVAAGAALQDTLDGLQMGFKGVLNQVGVAFMPMISGLAGTAQGYLQQLVGVVQGADGDIGQMAAGLGGILGQIATDLAAQLPALATAGVSILQSILSAIIGALPSLITAAVGIITSLIGFLVQNLPKIMQSGVQLLLTLVTAIIGALPALIGAAFQMIITLVTGIAAALPTLIPAIVEMLVLIITTIVENLPMLLEAALQLILGLVQGLAAALPVLIAAVPTILIAIVNTLTEFLPILVEMAPEIIVALITGIIGALPALGAAVPQIIATIISAIIELIPQISRAGWSILQGIWQGIADQLPWFWQKIKEFALSIWDAIKDALGIGSPSKLFADTIGPFIPSGIWEGIEGEMPKLQRQLAAAMRSLAGSYNIGVNGQMALAGAGEGMVNSNNTTRSSQFFITNAGIDAAELARIQRREELLHGG